MYPADLGLLIPGDSDKGDGLVKHGIVTSGSLICGEYFYQGRHNLILQEDSALFTAFTYLWGARGGVVVKALRYKPARRGFDSRCCHWNFSVI
jgi:hypothetical protein